MVSSSRSLKLAVVVLAITSLPACKGEPSEEPPEGRTGTVSESYAEVCGQLIEVPSDAADYAYRDAVCPPPAGWSGPVFELSHDYPASVPDACPQDVCGWLHVDVDFETEAPRWEDGWDDYMAAILDYVREGQSLDPDVGWRVEVNGETRWFHVPWMAFDLQNGRDFIHGMTNERPATLSDLLGEPHGLPNVPGSENRFETWAFGIYNPWGGHAFGGTWDERGAPVMRGDPPVPAGLPFTEGTLVAKLLFTTATPEEVGYLEGSPTWTVHRHPVAGGCARTPHPVRLVQMDVAVVDSRSPTRWVYGTFGYNGTLTGESPWERLSPLGLQWGNDEESFPAVAREESRPLRESVLAPINIYEHFGCEGRLAGPVDNKLASCMSCHGNAYAHSPAGSETIIASDPNKSNVPPIYGFKGICTEHNDLNEKYFSNMTFPETWSMYPDSYSLDTSLQMMVAFRSYGIFKTQGGPRLCPATEG